jgi:hypothetical protein
MHTIFEICNLIPKQELYFQKNSCRLFFYLRWFLIFFYYNLILEFFSYKIKYFCCYYCYFFTLQDFFFRLIFYCFISQHLIGRVFIFLVKFESKILRLAGLRDDPSLRSLTSLPCFLFSFYFCFILYYFIVF